MAEITAGMVKELRELTGLGMMECKKALEESGGDAKKAEELLRIKSGAKAGKAASRVAAEGVVAAPMDIDLCLILGAGLMARALLALALLISIYLQLARHLEDAIRDDLNARAPRVMAVLRPLKVTLYDSESNPTKTVTDTKKLIDVDKVSAIISSRSAILRFSIARMICGAAPVPPLKPSRYT